MSASREKKQRQGGTPSNKALTAKQQADQARRKTIEYTVIGVVVAILVAALLIWNSGFFQARATAVSVGGTSYTAAQTSYFYHSSYAYRLAQYMGYDSTKSPEDQTYSTDEETGEVTTYHDYFLQSAMDDMAVITALYDAALKDNMTAADVKDDVDNAIENVKQAAKQQGASYKQYLAAVYGSYVTPSVYKDCVTRTLVASQYQTNHQDGLTYTAEELQAYYEEHTDELDTFRYSYLYFVPDTVPTTDDDGNEIEMTEDERTAAEGVELAEAKTKADDALAALEDGDSVDDVVTEFDPTSYSVDTETEGQSLTSVYADWLKEAGRKAGDVTVVENSTNGYYVVVFEGRERDETPTVNTRHILIQAETDEDASAPTEEQMAAAKTKAEELLSQWQAGEATEDSFAQLANENSDDAGSNTNGGLYEKVYQGNFVTNYDAWLFEDGRAAGDTDIVENNGTSYYGYHVVYYVGQNTDYVQWMAKAEANKASEDAETWLEELKASYTAEKANGSKYLAQ